MSDTYRYEVHDGKVTNHAAYEPEPFSVTERKRWLFLGLPLTFTAYTLTNKKLTVNRGLFNTVEDDILLYRISDLRLKRSLWQKIFGLGSIEVTSSDKSLPQLDIHNIKNYREFKDLLEESIENDRLRVRFRSAEVIGGEDDGFLE